VKKLSSSISQKTLKKRAGTMFSWDVATDPDLHWPLLKLKYALCCGSGFFFDADPDPDFYLMRMQIRIRLFTLMRILIRILLFCGDPDPTEVAKMMKIRIRNTACKCTRLIKLLWYNNNNVTDPGSGAFLTPWIRDPSLFFFLDPRSRRKTTKILC
jgi:hypothetical protein